MANKRLYFACEAVGFAPDGSKTYTQAHGVQSIGINTTFSNEPVFELGQIKVYENIENIPDVEVSMEKVIDGYPLLWHLATRGATGDDLAARSNAKCTVALSLFPDTGNSASGTPVASIELSGLYSSSHSITIPVEGNISESVTMVGNSALWRIGSNSLFSGNFNNTDRPLALTYGSGGIQRRDNVLFTPTVATLDANNQVDASETSPFTVLPPDIAGISSSGVNHSSSDGSFSCSIQNISVSVNLGRDQILELGRKIPYFRYVTFPVEVTSEFEVISKSGHWISVQEVGAYANGDNTRAATIKVALEDGTFINLGTENRLTNVTIGGGDTGGGNQTLSYSFSTYNDYTITHPQDPN